MSRNMPEGTASLIELALYEDIGKGDITTEAIFQKNKMASGRFIAKEPGVVAGLDLAGAIFQKLDAGVQFERRFNDGDPVSQGDILAMVSGPANALLTAERTVLNFLQRMSGIASKTRNFVDAVSHTTCRILDTRKTVPGHRYLDKLAVQSGGGKNHRARLDDMFLIKENHIIAAGGIPQAINACNRYAAEKKLEAAVEIEVRNMTELEQVLQHGNVGYILLDNMTVAELGVAVAKIDQRFLTEASGNVTLETVGKIAETGVNFISIGALTHSVKALDLSLIFDLEPQKI
ncbi:MAG: carboxylating nicotinate-nucleotide diphosphorylase [Balneolales bacterium]